MPTMTLVLDRKPVQVYTLSQDLIRIGRAPGMDILIDNVSVSRRQAEIRMEGGQWVVRDLESSNGTFLNGERISGDRALKAGDEITFGKFSLFFERMLSEPVVPAPAAAPPARTRASAPPVGPMDGTLHLKPEEIERLQRSVQQKRQAHLQWEAGDERGTHFLEGGGAVVGRTELCDLRLPVSGGPKQHVVVLRGAAGFEVRNLSSWHRMRVNGRLAARSRLKNGDTIEVGRVRLTFLDEVR